MLLLNFIIQVGLILLIVILGALPWVTTAVLAFPFRNLALVTILVAFLLLVYLWQRSFKAAIVQIRAVEQAQRETAAYRLQSEALEAAVQAQTFALEVSLAREAVLGQLQSRIVTLVSHEFRTPLSAINTSAELLRQYHDKMSEPQREAAHKRIQDSIFYLNQLLKDVTLIDSAQREQIRPSYQSYPFSHLCQQLAEKLRQGVDQPERLQIQFTSGIETAIQTDLSLLLQIVSNLTSNALKYSPEATPVQIQFWLDNVSFNIEVQDRGIGIPAPEQDKIFDLFYRASNVDERRGLGLGLFIVQSGTILLRGTVKLVSQPDGQGSLFTVQLPIQPEVEP